MAHYVLFGERPLHGADRRAKRRAKEPLTQALRRTRPSGRLKGTFEFFRSTGHSSQIPVSQSPHNIGDSSLISTSVRMGYLH